MLELASLVIGHISGQAQAGREVHSLGHRGLGGVDVELHHHAHQHGSNFAMGVQSRMVSLLSVLPHRLPGIRERWSAESYPRPVIPHAISCLQAPGGQPLNVTATTLRPAPARHSRKPAQSGEAPVGGRSPAHPLPSYRLHAEPVTLGGQVCRPEHVRATLCQVMCTNRDGLDGSSSSSSSSSRPQACVPQK